MKNFPLFLIIFLFVTTSAYSQSCGMISGTKNKKSGTSSKGAVVTSVDSYSLLIQKRFTPTDTNYALLLHAASRVTLSDSILNHSGHIMLFLANGFELTIDNATCDNNPMGMYGSIGFIVETTEAVMDLVMKSPIKKIRAFELLETEFSQKEQLEQQKILRCLKNS